MQSPSLRLFLVLLGLALLSNALTVPRAPGKDSTPLYALTSTRNPIQRSPANPKQALKPNPKPAPGPAPAEPPQKPTQALTSAKATVTPTPPKASTPTFRIVRPITPVDTCKVPNVICEDDYDNAGGLEDDSSLVARALDKRGSSREYEAPIGNMVPLKFKSLEYPSSSELFKTRRGLALAKTVLDFSDKNNLKDTAVKDLNKVPTDYTPYVTEHIVELQTIKMFMENATGHGDYALSQTVDSIFFQDYWTEPYSKTLVAKRKFKVPIEMGKRQTLNDLVFEALGSSFNRKDFVLFEKELNSYKERLWSGSQPMQKADLEGLLDAVIGGALPSTYFLSALRSTLAVFNYLQHPTIASRMKNAISNVKMELANVKELTGKDATATNGQVVNLPDLWIEFMDKHLARVEKHGKDWLTANIKAADTLYTAHIIALKNRQTQLQQSEKQTGAMKQKYESDRKAKSDKLGIELKQKDTTMASAKKREDAARKVVKDIEDEIDREPKQAQKTAIRDKKDLKGKKNLLEQAEKSCIDATKARNLKDREIQFL